MAHEAPLSCQEAVRWEGEARVKTVEEGVRGLEGCWTVMVGFVGVMDELKGINGEVEM